MPRSRNIKPAFFNNDILAESNCPLGRLLFIGLWCLADYKGDLEWRPGRIKVQVLPYDDCDIKKLAINLDKSGFVTFYSDGEKIYLRINNFERHQNPHPNERKKGSDIPSYSESMRQAVDLKGITINREKLRQTIDSSVSDPADSCFLNPDPLLPSPREAPPKASPPAKKKQATSLPDDWKPTIEYAEAAKAIAPNWDQRQFLAVADKFKDYWISKSGKDATKRDWLATWRNWVRREVENGKNGRGPSGQSDRKSYGEQRSELHDAITDYERATQF